MSEFLCHRESCDTCVDCIDEDDLYEDKSGRLAYCSEVCFSEDCSAHSKSFNEMRRLGFTYTVGDPTTEEKLHLLLRQRNSHIAHSFDEGDYDAYPGGWHWFWIPDLQELRLLAVDLEVEDVSEVEYYDWEEFMSFAHPVKGIALIQAYDFLSAQSVSMYISKEGLQMTTSPSEPDFQK